MIIEAKIHPVYMDKPLRGTDESAGYDLRVVSVDRTELMPNEEFILPVGYTMMLGTGLYLDLGSHNVAGLNIAGLILPRSGLGCAGRKPGNAPGLIDGDYHGEIKVCLVNHGTEAATFKRGDRVAQLVFVPYLTPDLAVVNQFSRDTERGADGFGSTGNG